MHVVSPHMGTGSESGRGRGNESMDLHRANQRVERTHTNVCSVGSLHADLLANLEGEMQVCFREQDAKHICYRQGNPGGCYGGAEGVVRSDEHKVTAANQETLDQTGPWGDKVELGLLHGTMKGMYVQVSTDT